MLKNSARQWAIKASGAADGVDSNGAIAIQDQTAAAYRFMIDSAGRVGISNFAPLAKLDVTGTISASDIVQVGSTTTIACGSSVVGSIRYTNISDTLQIFTGGGWKSLISGTTGTGTVTGTGSATAVAYWSSASGLTYDTDGFYWDVTNNRLGIGTTVPTSSLQVSSTFSVSNSSQTTSASLYVGINGGVSIGSTTNVALGSRSGLYIERPSSSWGLVIAGQGANQSGLFFATPANTANARFVQMVNASDAFHIRTVTDAVAVGKYLFTGNLVSGNVGISNSSPIAKLDVTGTISSSDIVQVGSTTTIACGSSVQGSVRYTNVSDTLQICTGSGWKSLVSGTTAGGGATPGGVSGSIQFNSAGALAGRSDIVISATGNVGIGTAAPSQLLHVNGTAYATTFLHTSDRRLKTDIEPARNALDTAEKLRSVHFRWKKDGKASFGVIAQEVEPVMPEAVTTNADGIKAVDYDQLIPILIEAVKELKAANDNDAAEITRLHEEIEALKRRQAR
jgi:trimeric autotransporter adhesin